MIMSIYVQKDDITLIINKLRLNKKSFILRANSYYQATLTVTLIATFPMNKVMQTINESMKVKLIKTFFVVATSYIGLQTKTLYYLIS